MRTEVLDWQDLAACKGKTEVMFPESYVQSYISQAQKICNSCPVSNRCGLYGAREHHGIWGGQVKYRR